MESRKKAFSLIEVIVAGIILTISVFWVFKLIWENEKLINNSHNHKTTYSLFFPFEECLENIWYDLIKNMNNFSINFWNNLKSCELWVSNIISIDSIEYNLNWEIIHNEVNKFLDLKLNIITDYSKIEQNYRLFKR